MGRWLGLLALLNVLILVVAGSMELVRAKPAALLDFNADKVRLLGQVEGAAPVKPALPVETSAPVEVAPAPHQADPRCLAWPQLDLVLLHEIEGRLKRAGLTPADYDMGLGKRLGWWVYLPPFADAATMRAAIEVARQKGVKDIAPVRSGEMIHAVSLGAFPTLAKARAQEKRLRALGLTGTELGPRPNSGSATLTISDKVPADRLAGLSEGWGKAHAPVACTGN